MNKFVILIDQNQYLYELLKEIKFDIQYKLILTNNNIKEQINNLVNKNCEFLILTTNSQKKHISDRTIYLDRPVKINFLYEKINLVLSKNKYLSNSNLSVGNYLINLNSRNIQFEGKSLKLTEKELQLIMYLHGNKEIKKTSDIRKDVWKHSENVETHTVETHIYRLRKKINNKFEDNKFILSTKNGYSIK
tara:strand:+ start:288 stop:860 length:573 start_codon:yes stop_codon:yes gene_type:complete